MGNAPLKPGDLQLQNLKYLRFVDPEDETKIIQLALVDTGITSGDGIPIYALNVDSSKFSSKTIDEVFGASLTGGANVYSDAYELKNNKGIAITVYGTFHASATAGMEVWIETSHDGTLWDSLTDKFVVGLEPAFVQNTRQQRTTLVDSAPKFIRFGIKNLDGVNSIAGLYVQVTRVG